MKAPADLQYSETHEWVRVDGEVATVGISDFAQSALGDIVFVNMPEVGDEVEANEPFGDVESVKAVSELVSPVSGTVSAVNESLVDSPELLNVDPYGTWIIKVEGATAGDGLLDSEAYQAFCASQA